MVKIDEKEWIAFTVENIFSEIKATKGKTTGQLVKGDDVPYIAAAKQIMVLLLCAVQRNIQNGYPMGTL